MPATLLSDAMPDPWSLEARVYAIIGTKEVTAVMRALGIDEVFREWERRADPCVAFGGYLDHPTHWLVFTFWNNFPPSRKPAHRLIPPAVPSGYLLEAYPKADVRRQVIVERLNYQGQSADRIELPVRAAERCGEARSSNSKKHPTNE